MLFGAALALTARHGCARCALPPPPPAFARFGRAAGAGGPRPGPGPRLPGGFRWCVSRGSPRAADARLWRVLLVWGFPSPFPSSTAARVMRRLPFGGAPLLCPYLGPLRSVHALGVSFWVRWPPSRGVPSLFLLGVPPLAFAARRGRAALGGGDPSPFSPSSAARIKRLRLFGGSLSAIASLAVCPVALLLLEVSSPPAVCSAVPDDGAGLALTRAPSAAA